MGAQTGRRTSYAGGMRSRRWSTVSLGVALAAVALAGAGCAAAFGPADRVDEFTAAGQACVGSWWLGALREGTPDEARDIAESALATAPVTQDSLAAAAGLLDLSMSDQERRDAAPADVEAEAYMLAVTLHVKSELEAAGYPDSDRVIEVRSERSCS